MHGEGAAGDVGHVAFEGFLDNGKGQVVPGNLVQREQSDIQTFRTGFKFRFVQDTAKHHMHLADAGQAQHA